MLPTGWHPGGHPKGRPSCQNGPGASHPSAGGQAHPQGVMFPPWGLWAPVPLSCLLPLAPGPRLVFAYIFMSPGIAASGRLFT